MDIWWSYICARVYVVLQGGNHGECVELRKGLNTIMDSMGKSVSLCLFLSICVSLFVNVCVYVSVLHTHTLTQLLGHRHVHRAVGFTSSIFCPVPVGDSPSRSLPHTDHL